MPSVKLDTTSGTSATSGTRARSLASVAAIPRPSFKSNFATVFGGQVAMAAVALVSEICYARLLGPEGRGQISLCRMAIALGILVGGLGGEAPIIIWTADTKKKPSQWLSAVFVWGLVGGVIACCLWSIVFWRWHPAFLRGITSPLGFLVLITIPISIFFSYLFSMLTGQERFRLRAGLALAEQGARLLGVVALVLLFGKTAEMAVSGNLFGVLVAGSLTAIFLRKPLLNVWKARLTGEELRAALSLGLRSQLGNLATFFNYRLDVFIVNYFLNPAQVGLYAVGVMVSESLWQFPHAAALALFPRTARTVNEGASEFTCLVIRQVFFLVCVMAAAMALLSPWVIPLVFGARFSPSVPVIWWILPGTVAFAIGKVMSADLVGRSKPEYASTFALVSLVATVILDLLLIPRMGIQGAALASSVAYILDTALIAIALKNELKVSWKSLFVPSIAELASYRRAIPRCISFLRSAIRPLRSSGTA